jgi:hypothetical protein
LPRHRHPPSNLPLVLFISAFQPFSLSAFQPFSLSAFQPFSFSAFQLFSFSAFQLFSLSAFQPFSLSAFQPFRFSAFQLLPTNALGALAVQSLLFNIDGHRPTLQVFALRLSFTPHAAGDKWAGPAVQPYRLLDLFLSLFISDFQIFRFSDFQIFRFSDFQILPTNALRLSFTPHAAGDKWAGPAVQPYRLLPLIIPHESRSNGCIQGASSCVKMREPPPLPFPHFTRFIPRHDALP